MESTSGSDRIGVARPADGEGLTIAQSAEWDRVVAEVDRDVLSTLQKRGGLALFVEALEWEWHPDAVKDVMRRVFEGLFPARDCQRNQDSGPPEREVPVYKSPFTVYQKEAEGLPQYADPGAALRHVVAEGRSSIGA